MPACPIPVDETLRQQTLDEMNLLDTPAEHYLDTLVQLTQDLVKVDTVLISLIDQDRQWFKARVGLDANETTRDVSFCGYAILGEDTLLVPDATLDARFADNPLVLGPPYIRFYAGRPLRAGNGQAIGTLCMVDPRPRSMTQAQQANFRDLATLAEGYLQLRTLIQNNRDLRVEMDREQRKALLDPLTQLWNRGGLLTFQERECRMARESHAQLGVLYADLDFFKSINDQHGHAAGDQVLCECARRLRAALRPDDLLVRQGGEEFVALLKVKDGEELQRVAERVRQLIGNEPVPLASGPLPVSLSIGCTLLVGEEAVDQALERADAALYSAKQAGRNRVVFHASSAQA
ncbi:MULTISPECIES: sensor domain-containing diguanylate cyclase [Pseudomonas]|uniref:Sensor domain-containing diguanylate cyclase n=1 Tax=Pseudomonas nitroreducens TaxID=46680 RepID=A0A6G6J3M9_PSENT|nr:MULTISPECIES: sensor domain-containing diguanylate cyclase [Pseudomonas]MBG6290206.1 sensor domain-containing diguanylate cyclase [Pseudomonas nitroreducens]MCJ1881851.1 sensor domain-containing diguanylate cyclase [Pseudomonas nitroreducens]MCJ1898307.1 sensor domain-containing diguanylate cyclase [Pseudomonas nitroreducens]MDG9855483.1 sensor domain-containing diguanylate cyclase [Pseudomonas nitroreducens]NMZ60433.1 sensor domain-containing diguanylate cyclase [Pseudomonas nitroreducens]